MKLQGFSHVNVRCSEGDLPRLEKFYAEALGLKPGNRPDFDFAGLWLYCGDEPLVHISARFPSGSFVKDAHNASIDHIAFKACGIAAFRRRLASFGIPFAEQNVEGAGYQVFIHDPVGTRIELNFMDETVPDDSDGLH